MATSEYPPYILTPFDNVMPQSYVPTMFFFPESSKTNVSTMVDTLRDGLSKTLDAMKPLSGTIQAFGQQGGLCVTAPWNSIDDIFHVKDLTQEEGMEYQKLKDNEFHMKYLDLDLLLPMAKYTKDRKIVMVAEVNIIKGGLIVVLYVHHRFTDGMGTSAVTKVWAAHCRGDESSQCVRPEMMDRERLMQGWGCASLADSPDFSLRPVEKKASFPSILTNIFNDILGWTTACLRKWIPTLEPGVSAISQCEMAIFFFAKGKLAELKRMVSSEECTGRDDGWVSTNDALCALISCCVPYARDKEFYTMDGGKCQVVLPMSGRRLLDPPLPADYIGNVLSFIRADVSNQSNDSMEAKVAKVAHLIRSQIKQRDERYLRMTISALLSAGDFAKVMFRPPSASDAVICISSWANQGFYDLNWGDAVGAGIERVGFGRGVKNLCVILPELSGPKFTGDQCGLEVAIGLEKGQIERLKNNELFMRFAEWRGH